MLQIGWVISIIGLIERLREWAKSMDGSVFLKILPINLNCPTIMGRVYAL